MICADGTMIELMETQRYESQKQQIKGQLDVVGPGMILLIWDNSFSWLNTKQLAYSIELKQETLLSSEAKKVELARHARLTRERAVWNKENELDTVQTSIQTYEQTILDIKRQIEELQQHLQEKEDTRVKIIQQQEQVEDQIDTLCWEIQGNVHWMMRYLTRIFMSGFRLQLLTGDAWMRISWLVFSHSKTRKISQLCKSEPLFLGVSTTDAISLLARSMANKKWWQRAQNYHLSMEAEEELIPAESKELP